MCAAFCPTKRCPAAFCKQLWEPFLVHNFPSCQTSHTITLNMARPHAQDEIAQAELQIGSMQR